MRASFSDLPNYANHVLVDGAFDPLHAGHVAYLHAARQYGPLLCAVASDDQIREKGREPLLPHASRVAVLEALCDVVYAKDRPTEQVLAQMTPLAYVKGADWQDRLPPEQVSACGRLGVSLVFVNTPLDSSTARLRAWALADADRSLDQLTSAMAAQVATPPARYDRSYFEGDWRADGNAYTLAKRREIEGEHPAIIKACFPGMSILDVGCGPGYLVRFLKEIGVDAGGCDTSPAAARLAADATVIKMDVANVPDDIADVAICREVLEHCTVNQIPSLVSDLFRVARKAVYITTRFNHGALFGVEEEREIDPTHQSLLTQPFLRSLCVLNGGTRRRDLEAILDHQQKGRVLVYEVSR